MLGVCAVRWGRHHPPVVAAPLHSEVHAIVTVAIRGFTQDSADLDVARARMGALLRIAFEFGAMIFNNHVMEHFAIMNSRGNRTGLAELEKFKLVKFTLDLRAASDTCSHSWACPPTGWAADNRWCGLTDGGGAAIGAAAADAPAKKTKGKGKATATGSDSGGVSGGGDGSGIDGGGFGSSSGCDRSGSWSSGVGDSTRSATGAETDD
eukprot:jgi/Undpi1/4395/HiC_scaffold_17.g07752.m1